MRKRGIAMDYYPLRNTNRELPEQEIGEEEAVTAPVVDVVINDFRKNKETQVFAVQVSVTFPRTKNKYKE
jgi:hypothetical protein